MPLIRRNVLGKKLSPNNTIVMGKSSQKKHWNDFLLGDPGTMPLNSKKMLQCQLIAESTPCLPKKKKNNANSCPKTYAYKEFIAPSPLMPVDSSSFERKMASFAQFKITATLTNGRFQTNTHCH